MVHDALNAESLAVVNFAAGICIVLVGFTGFFANIFLSFDFSSLVLACYTIFFGFMECFVFGFGYTKPVKWFGLMTSWLGLGLYNLYFGLTWLSYGNILLQIVSTFVLLIAILNFVMFCTKKNEDVTMNGIECFNSLAKKIPGGDAQPESGGSDL